MESTDYHLVYQKYFLDVYKYVFSLCKHPDIAEEITQETFFKVLKNINHFHGESTLYTWLCQIAKNTLYNYVKKEKRYTSLQENMDYQKKAYDFGEDIFYKEKIDEIHISLHKLKEPYKEVFMLRVFAELSFQRIGDLFEKSDSWARVVFYRAKNKLKEELE